MPSAVIALASMLALMSPGGSMPGPPPNLRVDPALERVVARMWRTSPVFRAQCARIADEPTLFVAVWYDERALHGRRRAVTTFVRHARRLVSAQVRLSRGHDPVELLAHELEHIVEQLDGVDLSVAVLRGDQVRRARDGSFETRRAIEAGLRVQREVRHGRGSLASADPAPDVAATHSQQRLPPLRPR
ncbi:MAG: hypothetical protein GEV06_11570 [Luteitalea sp.]|nr:hypothetical protein [Luteitalea sp.]